MGERKEERKEGRKKGKKKVKKKKKKEGRRRREKKKRTNILMVTKLTIHLLPLPADSEKSHIKGGANKAQTISKQKI